MIRMRPAVVTRARDTRCRWCETCDEENEVEVITRVEVTDAGSSDQAATLPVLSSLGVRRRNE